MRPVKLGTLALPFLLAAAGVIVPARTARATIVERVVAVIGERPILLSELRHRAVPSRLQIRMHTRDDNTISAQENELYKELLNRMIDDRLEEQQADKARLNVPPEEIDRAILQLVENAHRSGNPNVTVRDVVGEVARQGMTEQDFREEIRRQLLEGKLIELRVRPRVRVTEQDARAAYQHWVQQLHDEQLVDFRYLALRVLPQWSQEQVGAREALAQELVRRARAGEDFCTLVAQYTDDVETRGTCGSRGPQPMQQLAPPIQQAVRDMKALEFSDPIRIRAGQDAILIVELMSRPRVPSYEEVQGEMAQRALIEGIERARKAWLQELRRGVYIDVRL
jgi:peptidyl-prolyl cis-trans isomerase SurA